MKRCPSCGRTYTDETLLFCLEDGTPLIADQPTAPTIRMPAEPPPTVAYDTGRVTAPTVPPAWTTTTPPQQQKRKVWPFVVGGLVLLLVFGGGLIAAVIWMASVASNENSNSNNANRVVNSNSANANQKPTPTPTPAKVEITRVYMARDNGGEVGEEVESFSSSDRTQHCVVELNNGQAGTTIKFNWIAVDAGTLKDQPIKELEYTTKGQETKVHADLKLQQDWPEGDWKVEVYLNGQFVRSVEYQIK